MKRLLLIASLFLCSLGAVQAENITSGGKQRSMIVYAPKNLPENRPLLISMHGMNQDMNYQRNQANYEAVADTAKFVVVYPQGEGNSWDLGGMKDINFILDIIDAMATRYKINRNRVYLSGFSMGGMMTYYAMTKIADKIAAFAPVSGYNMGGPNATSSRPIPIIHVHGTSDDVCTYSPVQSHIDAWVKRNKCKTTPVTTAKGTTGQGTLYRYTGGLNGVEVAHLKLPGKGHWHSNDAAYGMTNIEVWNFCNRFALGPDAPTVKKIEPENNSFDLTSQHRTFTLTLSKEADVSKASAMLKKGSKIVKLVRQENEAGKTLTFALPEETVLDDGEYTFTASGIVAVGGENGNSYTATYIYGVTEVQDVLAIDTLLAPNWPSMQEELGQCIPWGWKLLHTDSEGATTVVKSGTSGMASGCRVLYFPEGGDFTAGFYLSAREYAKARLSFGEYASYRMHLPKGANELTFRSTYWSTGARDAVATFDVAVRTLGSNNAVYYLNEAGVKPKGCQAESQTRKPTGTAHHSYVFDVPSTANYVVDFTMTQGWNSVLIADVMVTTYPSIPERYKGTLHRLLLEAAAICDGNDNPAVARLREAWDTYRDFASTSPTGYDAAIAAMRSAFDTLPVDVTMPSAAQGRVRYYSTDGRCLTAPQRGITIERVGNVARKIVRM